MLAGAVEVAYPPPPTGAYSTGSAPAPGPYPAGNAPGLVPPPPPGYPTRTDAAGLEDSISAGKIEIQFRNGLGHCLRAICCAHHLCECFKCLCENC